LTERVSRGEFDEVPPSDQVEALKSAWDAAIEEQLRQMQAQWPGVKVPVPRRWAFYEQTRTPLLRWLAETLLNRTPRKGQEKDGSSMTAVEEWLSDPGSPLGGRADQVEISAGQSVRVVDIKSAAAGESELRPAHVRQLLTYAYLWHATKGAWPSEACVQRVDGSRLCTAVDANEATLVVEESLELFKAYNAAAAKRLPAEALASPSTDACGSCDFRGACSPFFEALDGTWETFSKHVLGDVTAVSAGPSSYSLELAVAATNVAESPPHVSVRGIAGDPPATGTRVAVVNAKPTRVVGQLAGGWDTEVWEWP
jgi:hypothetical protein